jgi:hypothetical protein
MPVALACKSLFNVFRLIKHLLSHFGFQRSKAIAAHHVNLGSTLELLENFFFAVEQQTPHLNYVLS